MATCFRAPISIPTSMPASPSHSPSPRFPPTRLKTLRTLNAIGKPKFPMPPFNPNDPFLSKLASVAASSPDTLIDPSSNPDKLPLLDIFDSPQLIASSAHSGRSASFSGRYGGQYYGGRGRRRPPPDLPSILLDGRIVYIGMPLVPAVTELVISQLVYLDMEAPREPIYIYINSSGTTRLDGQTVAMESEGFAIYDAMMRMQSEIYTVGVGAAIGQACLLLAAGTHGKRYMMPHAKAMIQQPRVPPSGLRRADDVRVHAKEVIINRDTLVKLLAKHTGNSVEKVADVMKRTYYMDATKAVEFGVIDKILWRGQEKIMSDLPSPEDREKDIDDIEVANRF